MKIPENLKNNRGVIDLEKSELIYKDGRCYLAGPLKNQFPPGMVPPGILIGKHKNRDCAVDVFGKASAWAAKMEWNMPAFFDEDAMRITKKRTNSNAIVRFPVQNGGPLTL